MKDASDTCDGDGRANGTVLDRRTYHVFKYREKAILYDVATGLLLRIDDPFVFDLLDMSRQHDLSTVLWLLSQRYGKITGDVVQRVLAPFIEAGLFHYEQPHARIVERIRRRLKNHHPRRIQLYIAQACNLACVYCYAEENGSNQRGKLMTYETAREAVEHLLERSGNRKTLTVQFFGGEPLLNVPVMKRIVEHTEDVSRTTGKGFRYQISTNGTLLTEEIQDYIVQHDMGTLVSVDGDEETHNRQRPLRGGGKSYHLVMEKAKQLNEKFNQRGKRTLKIRANIINGPEIDPDRISSFFEAAGFTHIGISGIHPRPGEETEYSFDEEGLERWRQRSDQMFAKWLEAVDSHAKTPNSYTDKQVARALNAVAGERTLGTIRCGVGRNTNAVDVDGNIYPCHRYVGLENYIIGNVRTGIDEKKISDYYDRLINNTLEWCSACWARTKCGGPCPWEISKTDGEITPPSERTCRHTKHALERAFYTYVCLAERHPERLNEILGKEGAIIFQQPAQYSTS